MTNTTAFAPPPPDDQADELQSLLGDAYAAPPVPTSLMRRLDLGIEAQWGHSPGLVKKPAVTVGSALMAGRSFVRAASIAAALAATLLFSIMFLSGTDNYAWATVLDAIAAQRSLQVESGETVRRIMLHDAADESEALRTRAFIALLLGDKADGGSANLDGLHVIEEHWKREQDSIALHVRFKTADSEQIDVSLTLDPATSLPRTVRVSGGPTQSRSLVLSYPGESDSAISQSPVAAVPPEKLANTETTAQRVDEAAANHSAGDPQQAQPVDASSAEASLPLGAATAWRPVKVVSRTDDEVVKQIDLILERLWEKETVEPVSVASDEVLLRRVYLDLAGRTPTVTEVRSFLKDSQPGRYERLVERLVASPDHASHFATTWRTFLIPEGVDLSPFGGREAFDRWLADRFARNEPYDEVVRKLLLAEGRLSQPGPLLFYTALKLDPDQLAARTSRVFMGIRLECAQCHDHPFEAWSQADFWGYAAFFAQISRPKGELENVSKVMRVSDIDRGEVMLPETEMIVAPRLLGQTGESSADDTITRRQQLARWLTGKSNPYFARATVNRVWAQLFGRGIVDPVDDFGTQNPPLSPELLDLLASHLIDIHFDLRRVTRAIALSRAYRLSSAADSPDSKRIEHFAQMNVKTLTAPQLYDCISVATSLDQIGRIPEMFSVARFGNPQRESFLQQFASPPGNRVEYLTGIPQSLTLMNGEPVSNATGPSTGGLLKSLEAPFFSDDQRIEVLFLATLARAPRPDEMWWLREALPSTASQEERTQGLADILWALLNSAEFALNH